MSENVQQPKIQETDHIQLQVIEPSTPLCPICSSAENKNVHLTRVQMQKKSTIATQKPTITMVFACENCKAMFKIFTGEGVASS